MNMMRIGQKMKTVTRNSEKQSLYHSLEIKGDMTWQSWKPNAEYVKYIVLKNVQQNTTIKITHSVPKTKHFCTRFPEPIVLCTGASFTLPVTFRPEQKDVYEDAINIQTSKETFTIPLRAVSPQCELVIPAAVDVGFCALSQKTTTQFQMHNLSSMPAEFMWDVSLPFNINPAEGVLLPRSSLLAETTFRPVLAEVYQGQAVCKYGLKGDEYWSMTLHGTGKFSHHVVSSLEQRDTAMQNNNGVIEVDFHNIPIGDQAVKRVKMKKPITLKNCIGSDTASKIFRIEHSDLDSIVSVTFSPATVGMKYTEYFELQANNDTSKITIKCTGAGKGPEVKLSSDSINFMQVECKASKTLEICNCSDALAYYQFDLDCSESAFSINQVSGILKPKSSKTLTVTFKPSEPIIYYRRLICIVHNQGPLFVDVMGTYHSENVKPAILQKHHLQHYHALVQKGLSVYSPEQLDSMLNEGETNSETSTLPMMAGKASTTEGKQYTCPTLLPALTYDELFHDGYFSDLRHKEPHVSMDVREMTFGRCTDLACIEPKGMTVTNHTKSKITCIWMGSPDHAFSVTPRRCDIPPLKSSSFWVTFKPEVQGQFYGAVLECYAFYKSVSNSQPLEGSVVYPPWCLTLGVTGHTFLQRSETFLPRFELLPRHLHLPPVPLGGSAYSTIMLKNMGCAPILYDIRQDTPGMFHVKPCTGLLRDQHQIFVLEMDSARKGAQEQTLQLRMNDDSRNTQVIKLSGSADLPKVELENDGFTYFKPTCIHTTSEQSYSVRNVCKVPLRYEWRFDDADPTVLSVEPKSGIIGPNEWQAHTWRFSPKSEAKFILKPVLFVCTCEDAQASHSKAVVIRVEGEGIKGSLKVVPASIEYPQVVVGREECKRLEVVNDSSCDVHCQLHVHNNTDGDDSVVMLETRRHTLPARTKQTIYMLVKPSGHTKYDISISYQLLTTAGEDSFTVGKQQDLCHVLVSGVFPTFAVTDVARHVSDKCINKQQLWKLFNINRFNSLMKQNPLRNLDSSKESYRSYTRPQVDFNFTAAPVGAEHCVVELTFANSAAVPAEWCFTFPSEVGLEIPYWTSSCNQQQASPPDETDFSVHPKRGHLPPGGKQTVTVRYSHRVVGTNNLPVLFVIKEGQQMLLNFVGVTVPPERPYLHIAQTSHTFNPQPIGESSYPVQSYELYNGGGVPVKFSLDLRGLDELQQENYQYEIVACLTPKGEIQPGCKAAVKWRFAPLEAKTYSVGVAIHVEGGETTVITFSGTGYVETCPNLCDLNLYPLYEENNSLSKQVLQMSTEKLLFGDMPLFSQEHRLLFVTNSSVNHCMSFRWLLSPELNKFIAISPAEAMLKQGECRLCTVTFTATDVPALHDIDIVCEVQDETAMALYEQKLDAWAATVRTKESEFTITDNSSGIASKKGKSQSASKLRPLGRESPEVEFSPYKALPPIASSVHTEAVKELARLTMEDTPEAREMLKSIPHPPAPSIVHLGVTASVHSLVSFRRQFPQKISSSFLKKLPVNDDFDTAMQRSSLADLSSTEQRLLADVLDNIIFNLVEDATFHEALTLVSNERVPYYVQLQSDRSDHKSDTVQINSSRTCTKSSKATHIQATSAVDAAVGQVGTCPLILTEEVMQNTLQNIIQEAFHSEFSITAPPRILASAQPTVSG
ncbi:PREDICTED: coiled-coil domain-containing protein 108-like isoform X2 [Priapulus caudatus]|uniref:Coiled-coil domain-containing protein 108-like isoform X2 n=1 Tax=Priapulus caudatus TaxID=37621 RepID=A0ABM1ER36_PRICU|nr:PREDICTED: coiled-coil domain-containing protein 108-like isoform X2 [Priapulus caudatus]